MPTSPNADEPRPSTPDAALRELALASTALHPDDIPAVVARHADPLGVSAIDIYLSDLGQTVLVPFRPPGQEATEPLQIDGTTAGEAYRHERPVLDEEAGVVWLPLMDSAERLGVIAMATAIDRVDAAALDRWQAYVNALAETIANKSAYGDTIVRLRRHQPLTVAAELRWAMLPPLTFKGRKVTISGLVTPPYAIAGDSFDYAVDGSTAHLAIFDAIGHGLEAARIANLAVIGYRHGRRRDFDAVSSYRAIDGLITEQFGLDTFATSQFATLDLATGTLCWLNAGHPAPMLLRSGTVQHLPSTAAVPLGMATTSTRDPDVSETELTPGDRVLFFTDGVTEARSAAGEEFGRQRLADCLIRVTSDEPTAAETLRLLALALDAYVAASRDDATMLLLAWDGPPD